MMFLIKFDMYMISSKYHDVPNEWIPNRWVTPCNLNQFPPLGYELVRIENEKAKTFLFFCDQENQIQKRKR